jgi:hypothetical protein
MSVAFRTISTLVAACHMTGEAPQFDLVCEGHGAIWLPLDAAAVQQRQNADPRCQR